MKNNFEIIFLDEAFNFLKGLDIKHSNKILFNMRKVQQKNDPELLKKLNEDIWEFRTLFHGIHYRLLAFWDKTDKANTLIISTHGFIKKQNKVPDYEMMKAESMRKKYFQEKLKK